MRVLYAVHHPNTLSESYIRTEIEWMEQQGVETAMWAQRPLHPATYPISRRVYTGDLQATIRDWKPDLVHAHWFRVALDIIPAVTAAMLPMTVRGHSFGEESGTYEKIAHAVDVFEVSPAVERVWLFPHLAAPFAGSKVMPLPVCYEPRRYFPAPGAPARPPFVFRGGPGKPGKGLDEFMQIARATPEVKFILALTSMVDAVDSPQRIAASAPPNVEVRANLQHEEVASVMRGASVYLRGHDVGGHPYGMPISIAEAMGSGVPPLVHYDEAAAHYIGASGFYYQSADSARDCIRSILDLDAPSRAALRALVLQRARLYATDVVLPRVLKEWKCILAL